MIGYLILDDSVPSKPKGRKMAGLGRHDSAPEKQGVNGHCLFPSLYVLLGRRCPLEPRLYRQEAVCEREGVPFQSKVDLAVAEIETFEPVADTPHVLIDSWDHCRRVRRTAQRHGNTMGRPRRFVLLPKSTSAPGPIQGYSGSHCGPANPPSPGVTSHRKP